MKKEEFSLWSLRNGPSPYYSVLIGHGRAEVIIKTAPDDFAPKFSSFLT